MDIEEQIFRIENEINFNNIALQIFRFQVKNNAIYREYVKLLKIKSHSINSYEKIPFLPIQFFKSHTVICGAISDQTLQFNSSTTTSQIPSKHYIKEPKIYKSSFKICFQTFYGNPEDYIILALLPSYLEQGNSSLVYMIDSLIKLTKSNDSGFYLNNLNELGAKIEVLKQSKKKVILIGVSYALLDLAELNIQLNDNFIVMETGGMKGRRIEMLKDELHDLLKKKFKVKQIHSEYGMTELLSQAYSKGKGIYETPSWMKVLIRDVNDPLTIIKKYKTGGINVIDLANIYSCSFIATQDLGRKEENGGFRIMGRFDNSDIRGCNLMFDVGA